MTNKTGIYYRQGLAADELADVHDLVRASEDYDKLDLRVSVAALAATAPRPPSTWLSYRDGALVGFLIGEGLGEAEAEATGVTHPARRRQGVFVALVNAAKAACGSQGTPALILYADDRSAEARGFAAAVGAERAFSESKMRLADAGAVAAVDGRIELRRAGHGDEAAVAAVLAEDMDGEIHNLEQVVAGNMGSPIYRYYIAFRDGHPVGTLNVQTIDGEPYVYGFVVSPTQRRRGYGRAILAGALRDLAAEGARPVYLEVEPDNTPAVSLYRSLGFETLVTYDYYRLLV